MATIYLEWDNTAVNASGNALNQRLSWRQKTVGGSFFTSGTTPANDMAKTVNSASHDTAVVNKIYEYKVEALCTIGGPTPNSNGIQEGIAFECLPLSTLTSTIDSVTVDTNLTGTDITKVRYTLRKQSDNSLVSTSLVTVAANAAPNTFSGLDLTTDYYVQVSYLTIVNAVEVESSNAEYLAVSCGGNVLGYQISTIPECTEYSMVPDVGETLVINFLRCADGVADSLGSITPYTVCAKTGSVTFSSGTGTITPTGPCV